MNHSSLGYKSALILQCSTCFYLLVAALNYGQSHLEPVDGRLSNHWNEKWQKLGQHKDVPKGSNFLAALVIPPAEGPFYTKVYAENPGDTFVYASWFKEPFHQDGSLNGPINQGTLKIDKTIATRLHRIWLDELYRTHYSAGHGLPPSDGMWCVVAATDFEESKLLMGQFFLPQSAKLAWMDEIAHLFKGAVARGTWVIDGRDTLNEVKIILDKVERQQVDKEFKKK